MTIIFREDFNGNDASPLVTVDRRFDPLAPTRAPLGRAAIRVRATAVIH